MRLVLVGLAASVLIGAPPAFAHEHASTPNHGPAAGATANGPSATVDAFHAALRRGDTKTAAGLLADDALIFESVRKTHRCVIVEESWPMCGYGAEVAFRVQKECMDDLDAPVERVTSDDVPMPYARNLEIEVLPQAKDVIAAVKKVMYLQ